MKITVEANLDKTPEQIVHRIFDDETMIYVHTQLKRFCTPYVPREEGILNDSAVPTPEYLEYRGPYAHYQWEGEVYGPNFPIYENGVFAGFRSPKNKSKHPTGRELQHPKDKAPLATSHWEKAMMAAKGAEFCADIEGYLRRK